MTAFLPMRSGKRSTAIVRATLLLGCFAAMVPVQACAQADFPAVLASLTGPGHLAITGVAADRTAAMIAQNRALSPENAIPTEFHAPVSLNDPDIMAKAQALSDRAGHNGLHYDYFRFRMAIDKLRQTKGDKLDIPTATYNLYPPEQFPSGQGIIEVAGLSHVVIDGHGSTLLFYSIGSSAAPLTNVHPRGGIHLVRSDHIAVRDLVLDWPEPLAVPVRIDGSGVDGRPQTMTVDSAFQIDPGSPPPFTVFIPFDVTNHRFLFSRNRDPADLAAWLAEHAPGGSMPYTCPSQSSGVPASTCFRYTGGQTYVFGPNEHFHPVPANTGNYLATIRDNNFAAIVGDGQLSYVTLSGITIYASPGAGIQFIGSGPALRITHCRVTRKPDALLQPGEPRRYISTNADGVNFISTAGDLVLEDSEIGDQADDGLNVNAALRLGEATGPNTLLMPKLGIANFYRVGGTVDVLDTKARSMVVANATISAVAPLDGGTPPRFPITLGNLPGPLQPGQIYQVSVRDFDSSRVLVRNNWFHDNSERGVVVHGRDFAVINNRFDRTAESAISALHDDVSKTAEGEPVQNLVIAGNVIHDSNVQWFDPAKRNIAPPAAIAVNFASRTGFGPTSPQAGGTIAPTGIVIANNVITDSSGSGVLVSRAQDVVIEGNRVSNSGSHRFGAPAVDGIAIVLEDARKVHAAGNQADRPMVLPGQ